ncbi:MAG: PAS domain-containing protein [Alphaproteobacteria bacterium]|nr:PAS domain-containing protein [Alphaproteobacteria bacterium]
MAFVERCRAGLVRDGRFRRAAFDPVDFAAQLSHLILSERTGPRQYFYRVVGTAIVARYGAELSRHPLDAHTMGDSQNPFIDMLEATTAGKEPVFLSGTMFWTDRDHIAFQQVTLPLADDADRPRFAMTFIDFQ